jgi:Na+/serine symporter
VYQIWRLFSTKRSFEMPTSGLNFTFNIALGKIAEYAARVNANDPTNSALIIVPVDVGAIGDAVLKDVDTLAAVVSAGVTIREVTGWTRKELNQGSSITITVTDGSDVVDVDFPDPVWTAVTAGVVTDLILCYDSDTTAGTDTNLIPLTKHTFPITPDGSDVTAVLAAAGFFRAS